MQGKEGEDYKVIEIEMEDGSIGHTYISPTYNNFEKWKWCLNPGKKLTGLKWKDKEGGLIDGDSQVECVGTIQETLL